MAPKATAELAPDSAAANISSRVCTPGTGTGAGAGTGTHLLDLQHMLVKSRDLLPDRVDGAFM